MGVLNYVVRLFLIEETCLFWLHIRYLVDMCHTFLFIYPKYNNISHSKKLNILSVNDELTIPFDLYMHLNNFLTFLIKNNDFLVTIAFYNLKKVNFIVMCFLTTKFLQIVIDKEH